MAAYASCGTRGRPGAVLGSGTCGNGGCLAELWGLYGKPDPAPLKPGDTITDTVVPGQPVQHISPAGTRPRTPT